MPCGYLIVKPALLRVVISTRSLPMFDVSVVWIIGTTFKHLAGNVIGKVTGEAWFPPCLYANSDYCDISSVMD